MGHLQNKVTELHGQRGAIDNTAFAAAILTAALLDISELEDAISQMDEQTAILRDRIEKLEDKTGDHSDRIWTIEQKDE